MDTELGLPVKGQMVTDREACGNWVLGRMLGSNMLEASTE
jgi:hypothetical protein